MEFVGRGRYHPRFENWLLGWENGETPINIWLGVSVEDQQRADERISELLKIPAKVKFLSVEPLLGPIDLGHSFPCGYYCDSGERFGDPWYGHHDHSFWTPGRKPEVDWVIVGGESGPKARPCNIEWIRSIVGQCKAASVPCFVKQLGSNPQFEAEGTRGEGPMNCIAHFKHKKGGDPSEWPEDLRVREFPNCIPV